MRVYFLQARMFERVVATQGFQWQVQNLLVLKDTGFFLLSKGVEDETLPRELVVQQTGEWL